MIRRRMYKEVNIDPFLLLLISVSGGILDPDKVERLTAQVGEIFEDGAISMDSISKLVCGASMVHNDLLDFDSWMNPMILRLQNIDLSPVPIEHLESPAYCVTGDVLIKNVSGCDMVSLLTSLKCDFLIIGGQNLGRKETRALVRRCGRRSPPPPRALRCYEISCLRSGAQRRCRRSGRRLRRSERVATH